VISRGSARRAWRIAAAALLSCAAAASLRAQPPRAPAPAQTESVQGGPDDLDVMLVTFGQGELVFERFGHNAIWIHEGVFGTDVMYDWGNFSFQQPHFLQRFLSGVAG
jgi:hypothetical protein